MIIKKILLHVKFRRKLQIFMLVVLTIFTSFAEIISLGAILPFIGILTQPEAVLNYPMVESFFNRNGVSGVENIIFPLALLFALAALMAGAMRLTLLYAGIRIANGIGVELSIQVYERTLYQKYSTHIIRNTSEVISGITQKISSTTSVLTSFVTIITSGILFIAIFATLLLINYKITIFAAVAFGSAYIIIALLGRSRMEKNSYLISQGQTKTVKSLQEGLGAIRDILLDGTQKVYVGTYSYWIKKLQHATGENNFINQAPRYAMESLGLALIAGFVLIISNDGEKLTATLPVLAALALGAQKLLPLMQQIYGNWSVFVSNKAAVVDVLNLLNQPLPLSIENADSNSFDFKNSIELNDLSFRYSENSPWVLNNINVIIPKGDRLGVVGQTGSGKSTLLDLLMCLLEPTAGNIKIDGKVIDLNNVNTWQRMVAHVPQAIYLSDATIAENIAFGVPSNEIDYERVRQAARQAKINEFIESKADGYDAFVGERGVRLSGGQRQRIGIARALYKQASVLIFDEATSALDHQTEIDVMKAIEGLGNDLTIIIIAHRLSTLDKCNRLLQLDRGGVNVIRSVEHVNN